MADSEWTMELEQVSEASMGHSRTCRGPLRHEAEIYYKAFVDGEVQMDHGWMDGWGGTKDSTSTCDDGR